MHASAPRVWVIDDDAAMRASLVALLASAGLTPEAFATAEEFLAAAPHAKGARGCVLTDVRMAGMGGLALLTRMQNAATSPPVIVMTGHADVAMAVRALKGGAFDFIEKPFSDDVLLAAITGAHAQLNDEKLDGADPRFTSAAQRVAGLTAREREVLELLAEGKPNKIIAHELGLSQRTVEVHRARMMERLAVGSLAEALRIVVLAELADHSA
jgi:two-component system, LuxR family, response regulator FixJ